MNLDTFLTTLYVLIDDWYKAEIADKIKRHAGASQQMSDSEVLTLAIVCQWRVGVPWQSERGMLRYMHRYGRGWFPSLLQKSQYNQRVRQLWSVLVSLQQYLTTQLAYPTDVYEVVDCTELPHCSLAHAATHKRHWVGGGRLGRGGNQGGWYYGEQLLMSVTASGTITGWLIGSASIDDRWMLEAFLSGRKGKIQLGQPSKPAKKMRVNQPHYRPTEESFSPVLSVGRERTSVYLADKGFNGERWITHWRDTYDAHILVAPPTGSKERWSLAEDRWLSRHRQIVETVFARLQDVFGIKRLNAHSDWGKLTRLAAKTVAYNLGILFNRLTGRLDGALATLIQ